MQNEISAILRQGWATTVSKYKFLALKEHLKLILSLFYKNKNFFAQAGKHNFTLFKAKNVFCKASALPTPS